MRRFIFPIAYIVIGFALGAGLGLYLGWVVWPTEFTDSSPALLSEEAKYEYVVMIASAYEQDNDLSTARWRLATLGAEDVNSWYLNLIIDQILAGERPNDLRRLARLAHDMGLQSPALDPYLPAKTNGS